MQTIYQSALDIMAQWPDDKYARMIGYMRENMDARDIEYIESKRRIMADHGNTFPRQAAFTLIQR